VPYVVADDVEIVMIKQEQPQEQSTMSLSQQLQNFNNYTSMTPIKQQDDEDNNEDDDDDGTPFYVEKKFIASFFWISK